MTGLLKVLSLILDKFQAIKLDDMTIARKCFVLEHALCCSYQVLDSLRLIYIYILLCYTPRYGCLFIYEVSI